MRFANSGEVLVTTSGSASLEGLDDVVADLLGDPRYRPGLPVLFDHSQLDWSLLQPGDLIRRLHFGLKEADLIGPSRIAVVTHDDRIRDARALRTDEPAWRPFRTVDDARRWLDCACTPS